MDTITIASTGATLAEVAKGIKDETEIGDGGGGCIDNTELLASSGLRILHVRPYEFQFGSIKQTVHNGMTLAYKINRRTIEVATAVCHRVDTFTKKVGTKTAIEHFQAGKTILVPIIDNEPLETLRRMFGA